MPAPALKTFVSNASLATRVRWSMEAWELIQYRTARINLANGRRILGFCRLAVLALCRPFAIFNRIASMMRTQA
jgi:hypothetical protein